ncbi:hypothetical protein NQ176_g1445 [Zarea fungicola]|uniref:Uncharacterized protein n=1 Tax=Zarea fungicola TaxID=93591 RepID=A0ACC1NSU3_9HYPO|nr:hypothetical protein NQ176_g1445 [Lecanicillium fungicola]
MRDDGVEVKVVGGRTMLVVCSPLEDNMTGEYIPMPSARYKCDETPSSLAIVLGIVLSITHFPSIFSPLSQLPKMKTQTLVALAAAAGSTLKPHHSFLVKPIFSAAMSACPYRKDFYAKLGDNDAKVSEDLQVYLKALAKIVGILKQFVDSKEAKW